MRRKVYDKGYVYIVIATLCLMSLFVGYNKVKDIEKRNLVADKSAVLSIKSGNNNKKNIESSILHEGLNTDNFFLKLLVSANTYMKVALKNETGKNTEVELEHTLFNLVFGSFEPKAYLKSHLPAIFELVETTDVNGNNFNIIGNSDQEGSLEPVLGDIVFVESPDESTEGALIPGLVGNEEEVEDVVVIPDTVKLDDENPSILIYHTHGTEAYLPITENQSHTTNREYNVLTIGEIIGKKLSGTGHKVKHIEIYHDIPSYDKSYPRSLATVKDTLREEESIKIIFDVHRDGVDVDASYREQAIKESKITINGKDVATFSLVIGPQNTNKEALFKFAKYIEATSNNLYPGLCKGIIMKPYGRFNQYVLNHYALLEVGSNLNTMEEAENCAEVIADVLHEVIEGIKE